MKMEVRLVGPLCTIVLFFAVISARNVNSKPGTFEDTYGDSEDAENKDIQNDEYEDYNITGDETGDVVDENVPTMNEVAPEIITKPQVFTARIGEVLRLPCEITNPEMVIVWKKDESVLLYQGDLAVKPFPNIKKTSEGLDINVTSNRDYGQYACQMMISNTDNPKIIHTIVPPTPPVITSIRTVNNNTVFNVGDTLEMTCIATGRPQPKVSWHKGSERIEPSGENITILNLKPHNAGIYRCLADNGIIPPAHSHIEINIEHKPIVTIDRYLINSNKENDAELKCTVHAYPPPVVNWQKDGMNIKTDSSKFLLKRHQNNVENILVIKNLTDAEFGEYTCSASNKFGKVEKAVNLVKVPVVQGFVKPEKSNKDVVLTWKVQSKAPITEHQLQYRKKGEGEWKNIKPEVSYDGEKDIYMVKYTLKGLEPGSYETRARSQNAHGWSDYSDIMPFEGVLAKHKPHHKKTHKEKDMKEKQAVSNTPAPLQENESPVGEKQAVPTIPAPRKENESPVGASQTGGCATVISSMYLTSIALLTLWYRQ